MFRRSRFRLRFACSTSAVALATVMCLVGDTAVAQRIMADPSPPGYARNLLIESAPADGDNMRIVGGTIASAGAWPSMVTLHRRDSQGGSPFCGGTVIDTQWVLTAAHCIVKHLQNPQNLYIREGANVAGQGRALNVTSIAMHENYIASPAPLNDIALLRLAAPAQSARQVLLPGGMRRDYLQEKKMSTVIGFGLVNAQPIGGPHSGPSSERLLQVDLPLVSQPRCIQRHGAQSITDAALCAGFEEGGKDSCNGDSGGPLYMRSPLTEMVQVGIVSWGPGCAQANAVGVYASVGHFESWIRQRVPNAVFARAQTQNQPGGTTNQQLQAYGQGGTGAQPSQLAQVSIDIAQGAQIKVGDRLDVRVTSSVAGHLFIFNQELGGKAYQIFPNRLSGGNLPGQARAHINAGQRVSVPGPMDKFVLRIRPPAGKNRVIALVVPSEVRIDDLAQKNEGMQAIEDFDGFLASIVDREHRTRDVSVEAAEPTKRAVAIREYDIVP